jgi:putative addiction module component (TIGR02574 family)
MKPLELPLDRMTAREKLRAIETIWEDLARNDRQVKSPDWHFDELKAREQRRKAGKEKALDWEAAKKELRRRHP